jgi:hypothetical protein
MPPLSENMRKHDKGLGGHSKKETCKKLGLVHVVLVEWARKSTSYYFNNSPLVGKHAELLPVEK